MRLNWYASVSFGVLRRPSTCFGVLRRASGCLGVLRCPSKSSGAGGGGLTNNCQGVLNRFLSGRSGWGRPPGPNQASFKSASGARSQGTVWYEGCHLEIGVNDPGGDSPPGDRPRPYDGQKAFGMPEGVRNAKRHSECKEAFGMQKGMPNACPCSVCFGKR